MRQLLGTVSDRLLHLVAPRQRASAINCWQYEACYKRACAGGRNKLYEVDPCNDRQRWTCGAC
ncbi:hypothetical protein [Longispora albida]|uniref:hypothetical protein n=1 Tax=Longispora albida TaxID=203523 RepID=UPI000364E4F2|nr:hypothetical protein [Longispora albida]